MITIKRFITCMIILLIVCIGCMYWIYHSRQVEINHLQAEVNILWNYKLNEPGLKEQIATLKADKAELQQKLDKLNIHYAADEKYIDVLEGRYLRCETYAVIAEKILKNNGINFTRIEE